MRRVVLASLSGGPDSGGPDIGGPDSGGPDSSATDLPALARQLRDAGVEVVYTGPTTPAHLAATVAQEDPDAVVVDGRADEVAALLRELDAEDIPVLSAADAPRWADTPGERSHHAR
ncbi:hypothetical protein ACTG9Q_20690 [Actinokineospora sp. 24-640]